SSTAVPNTAWVKRNVGSGGGTPGIDDVLAQAQALTTDRTIDIGSHSLITSSPDFNYSDFKMKGVYGRQVSSDGGSAKNALVSQYANDSTSGFFFQTQNGSDGSITLFSKNSKSNFIIDADSFFVFQRDKKIVTISDSA